MKKNIHRKYTELTGRVKGLSGVNLVSIDLSHPYLSVSIFYSCF